MGNTEAKTAVLDEMGRIRNSNAEDFNTNTFTALLASDVEEETIFQSLNPNDIRELRTQKPGLLCKLIQSSIYVVQKILNRRALFNEEDRTTILNSLRFLSRILPIVFENDDDLFVTKVLWYNTEPHHEIPDDDSDEMEEAMGDVQIRVGNDDNNLQMQKQPYAAVLIDCLMELLFIPGFTVASHQEKLQTMEYYTLDKALVWSPGVGVKGNLHYTSEKFESNRYTVLKCMIALSSITLYSTIESAVDDLNPMLWLLSSRYTKNLSNLFYSLLNTIVTYNPNSSKVPYMNRGNEKTHQYYDICTQAFMIMTDFRMPSYPRLQELLQHSRIHKKCNQVLNSWKRDFDEFSARYRGVSKQTDPNLNINNESHHAQEEEKKAALEEEHETNAPTPSPLIYSNAFMETLSNIRGRDDCVLIYDGICRLLRTLIDSKNTYLYGSVIEIGFQQELIYIFSKFINNNQHFLFHFLFRSDPNKVLVSIVYLLVRSSTDYSQIGLFHMCAFLLMTLSAEREFCVSLNRECTVSLPLDLPLFSGTYGDLLIISLHKVISSHFVGVQAMYEGLLRVVTNVSPYMMNISLIASRKLLDLLGIFMQERYLFKGPEGYVPLVYILESFNNMIQYQYSTSSSLVYMILRCRNVFETLRGFSLFHRPLHPSLTKEPNFVIQEKTEKSAEAEIEERGQESARKTTRQEVQEEEDEKRRAALEESKGLIGQSALPGEDDDEEDGQPARSFSIKEEMKKQEQEEEASKGAEPEKKEGESSGAGRKDSSTLAVINPNAQLNTKDERPHSLPQPWKVSEEWIEDWKAKLPLVPVMKLIYNLYPRVQEFCTENSTTDDAPVVEYIKTTTMVGILPVPHSIFIRKLQESPQTRAWTTSFLWGVIFQRNKNTPMFDSQFIKLFALTTNSNRRAEA